MTTKLESIKQETRDLIAEVKELEWSSIKLTRKHYRGAINTYRTKTRTIVPVFFYLDEAFTVEDDKGLFGVQDLKYNLQENNKVNLEETGRIQGLKLVAYKEGGGVKFVEQNLDYLEINTQATKEDITKRLEMVYRLGAEVEVEL